MEPTNSESRHRLNGGGRSSAPAGSGEYIKVVESQCETDGFVNEQWTEPAMPGPVPWKTIIIILLLFIGGIVSSDYWCPHIHAQFLRTSDLMSLSSGLHRLCHLKLGDGHEPGAIGSGVGVGYHRGTDLHPGKLLCVRALLHNAQPQRIHHGRDTKTRLKRRNQRHQMFRQIEFIAFTLQLFTHFIGIISLATILICSSL